MAGTINDPDVIRAVVTDRPRVAVVGISSKPDRASHEVAKFLIEHGYDVVPVNPNEREILGRTCYPHLDEVPGSIEVVDIFRKPEEVGAIVESAIDKDIEVVWMQLGVVNEEAARRAAEAGLDVVMDHCMKQETEKAEGQAPEARP